MSHPRLSPLVPDLPPIVGITEIAKLYGATPQMANKWAESKRFPPPAYKLLAGRFWLLSDVEAWRQEHRPDLRSPITDTYVR